MGLFSSKTANKVIDFADKLFYSKQEVAVDAAKTAEAYLEYMKTVASENTVRSYTRRIIAIIILGLFCAVVITTLVSFFINKDFTKLCFDLIEGNLGTLTMMVGVFYFGPYMLNYLGRKKK
jgi:hypothetical protein